MKCLQGATKNMFHLLLAIIYLSFISLGLPDAVLGSAWPMIYPEFDVPVSYAGIISITISMGTIFSSLQSDRLTKKFGTGKVTAFSVLLTAIALFGFSVSSSFWMMLLWALPYGLGAGSVDASINNYAAIHYAGSHMSWLHCMWGIGASLGPYILSFTITHGQDWSMGYRYISILQVILTIIIMLSLPLWNKQPVNAEIADELSPEDSPSRRPLSLKEIFSIPGAKSVFLMFFGYCALEQTAILWSSSYLVLHKGIDPETAAAYGAFFLIGLTAGRAVSGFVAMKMNDNQMIRLGQVIVLVGIIMMLFPFGEIIPLAGLIVIGIGCAPIYPCVIHSTPINFGADKSQAIVGVQMACAYLGSLVMPAIFGLIANHITPALFPYYMFLILALMFVMHMRLMRVIKKNRI